MKSDRRRPTIGDIWKLALAVIGAIAIVQELRKPSDERTWHGKVSDVVPYDFRLPTIDKVRLTYWNPDGPFISSKAFGVGWAFNFGALTKFVGENRSPDDSDE